MSYPTPDQQKSHKCTLIAPGTNINKQINKDFYFINLMQHHYITKLKPRMWCVHTRGSDTHKYNEFWPLYSLHPGKVFRKQREKNTTEYSCLFHAIECHFAHSKTLPHCIRRSYFTADEIWIVVLQCDYYLRGIL